MTALNLQLEVPPDLLAVLINPKLTIRELAKKIETQANDIVEKMIFNPVPKSVEEQCELFLQNADAMQQPQIRQWVERQSSEILEPFSEEMNEYLYSIRWHVAQLDLESWDHWSEAMKQVATGLEMASRERLSEALNDARPDSETIEAGPDDEGERGPIDDSIRGLVPFTNPMTGETKQTLCVLPWVTKDVENT